MINVIYDGPEGGNSGRQRKKWARAAFVGAIGTATMPKKIKRDPITFADDDLPHGAATHRDMLIIAMDMAGKVVRRVLVDTGSSVNVLYSKTFARLGLSRTSMRPINTSLAGFTGDVVELEGSIRLRVKVGEFPRARSMEMDFVVIDLGAAHNVILGRPGIEDLGTIISLEHQCMKFRTTE